LLERTEFPCKNFTEISKDLVRESLLLSYLFIYFMEPVDNDKSNQRLSLLRTVIQLSETTVTHLLSNYITDIRPLDAFSSIWSESGLDNATIDDSIAITTAYYAIISVALQWQKFFHFNVPTSPVLPVLRNILNQLIRSELSYFIDRHHQLSLSYKVNNGKEGDCIGDCNGMHDTRLYWRFYRNTVEGSFKSLLQCCDRISNTIFFLIRILQSFVIESQL
jgi:hypothetical protein